MIRTLVARILFLQKTLEMSLPLKFFVLVQKPFKMIKIAYMLVKIKLFNRPFPKICILAWSTPYSLILFSKVWWALQKILQFQSRLWRFWGQVLSATLFFLKFFCFELSKRVTMVYKRLSPFEAWYDYRKGGYSMNNRSSPGTEFEKKWQI